MAYFRCGGGGSGGGTIGGTATNADILSGKTVTSGGVNILEGSMTNNGAVTQSLNCGQTYSVPEGYHNGSGEVTANSLASQTGVDSGKTAIDASHVPTGYQGWVNGNKITGVANYPTESVSQDFNISVSADVDNYNGQRAVLSGTIKVRATYNPSTGTITLARVSGSMVSRAYSWSSGWQGPATASSNGSISNA